MTVGDDPTDREAAIRGLRHRLHDEIEISDDGRILEAPDGTRLVNGRLHEPDTWIDRRSQWGNPFKLDGDGGDYGRGESVRLYKGWFLGHVERDKWDPETLRGEDLGCWCVPWLCHGVVILNYLTETHGPDADQQTLTDGGRTADAHPAEGDATATGGGDEAVAAETAPADRAIKVAVPTGDSQGECYHTRGAPCGAHIVRNTTMTLTELRTAGLYPCQNYLEKHGLPQPTDGGSTGNKRSKGGDRDV